MKTAMLLCLTFLLFLPRISNADPSSVVIEGTIVNHKGRAFPDVTVHAIGSLDFAGVQYDTRTDASGKFHFDLPPGTWLIRVDPDELIVRGYSCFPDWQQPVFTDVTELQFEVIPTRPLFSAPRLIDGKVRHTVTFDTTSLAPIQTIRTYDIQWSTDQKEWKTFTSVSLVSSPLEFDDPDAPGEKKFYRAILVETEP